MLRDWIRKLVARSKDSDTGVYVLSEEDSITVVTPVRDPSVDETLQIVRYIFENEIYERRLFDFGNIEARFSIEELRQVAALGASLAEKPNRLAVVVHDDVGFGSTRAFGVYRDSDGFTETRVFRDRDEAKNWLLDGE